MNTSKAILTEINHAGLTFSGLMMPDGQYLIGVSQLNSLNLIPQKNASRVVKGLLGKEFQFLKVLSELHPKRVDTLTLEQFGQVVKMLAKKGNEAAWAILEASLLEKLERIFDASFGVEIDEREREQRFAARLMTKATFRPLTDELQRHGFTEGWQYGKYISKFQAIIGFEDGTRDKLPLETLLMLGNCQAELKILMRSGYTPEEALVVWQENR